jgi:hypothetical protein
VVLEQNERRVPPPGRGDWQHSPRRTQLFHLQVRKEREKRGFLSSKPCRSFTFLFSLLDCEYKYFFLHFVKKSFVVLQTLFYNFKKDFSFTSLKKLFFIFIFAAN